MNQTRVYYAGITREQLCSCGYCMNYYLQIKAAYPAVAEYLTALGVDAEKPMETSPLSPDENGILEYCACQYIVFGKCPDSYAHRIDDVEFRKASSHPRTGIEQEHFVLECYPIRLKYLYDDTGMQD